MSAHHSDTITRRCLLTGTAAFAATAALASAGCAGGSGQGTAGSSGSAAAGDVDSAHQVIVAMSPTSEPAAGFDPLVSWGCGEHIHEPLIQSTLITTDADLAFQGDLATSWECSEDGLTWTFLLRDDVVFSDGEPLSAEDVAFTVNSAVASDTFESDLSMVDEAVALDGATVELHLNKPYNALLYTLAVLGIVPAHAYGEGYGAAPVGSGRYLLERWDRGQQAIFRANPSYYGEAPRMERVVVVFMDEDAALAAVQAGEVDIAYTYATHAHQAFDGFELVNYATVDSRGISLPAVPAGATKAGQGDVAYAAGNDVTCDVAVRRAIIMGLDRDRVIEHVLEGFGAPAFSVSDGMPWSSADMEVACDPEGACALLDAAGWVPGEDGVRAKDGLRVAFDLWYASDDSVRQAMAYEVAAQLAQLGLEVSPRGGSWDEIYPHQYEAPVLWGWGSNSPVEVYALNYSTGWGNYACYESAAIDGHLDDALAQQAIEDSYVHWQLAAWDGEDGFAPEGAATWAWVANVDHLYFKRTGLDVAEQKPHPHGHGWSLVNNVDRWSWA
ncbi:ABC transporter substrate-binding protein [[Collinsella] massiliensis]|uniref:ABC transporter substrate-binding protein n=1 Tax=[Collinsella] massiliensis TaxID=1232426 RepID=A0A1Y3XTY9_9ACTN|nr:ABC transporter substrate-binding protein [[Collinsella] massiliensis]OUN89056.1 ABC transporter substrate-binding protein [[Collinsella] massiliensis]